MGGRKRVAGARERRTRDPAEIGAWSTDPTLQYRAPTSYERRRRSSSKERISDDACPSRDLHCFRSP